MINLWNEEISLDNNDDEILLKINNKKKVSSTKRSRVNKSLSFEDRLLEIERKVKKILGKRIDETEVITDLKRVDEYITIAISNGLIVIDTETNNSLDPLTCKLMGLCLYTPTQKQAYIPVNHVDVFENRLINQITEEQINSQLQRVVDSNIKIIYHNAKFDYQVIKETCKVELSIYWDTLLGAKILNENEPAGLKEQYHIHIDPEQEKYSIEELFEGERYARFPASLFALYAATDARMTYDLYLYQVKEFAKEGNKKIFNVFMNVEMPCVQCVAEMELTGIEIDVEYASRLSKKYHNDLTKIEEELNEELHNYDGQIQEWLSTEDANVKPKEYVNKPVNTKDYHHDEKGYYKYGKSKAEQLGNPINLDSPIQLSILLYDILKLESPDKKNPRGTGKDIIKSFKIKLVKLILERKSLQKLVKDFIDSLPKQLNIDGRIHCHFNQYGADTGRFSSSGPNLQQVPSKAKDIRMMFKASDNEHNVEINNDFYEISYTDEVLTISGWKNVKDIVVGDIICGDNNNDTVIKVEKLSDNYLIYV